VFKHDLDDYVAVAFFFGIPIAVFCAVACLFSVSHAIALLLILIVILIIL